MLLVHTIYERQATLLAPNLFPSTLHASSTCDMRYNHMCCYHIHIACVCQVTAVLQKHAEMQLLIVISLQGHDRLELEPEPELEP